LLGAGSSQPEELQTMLGLCSWIVVGLIVGAIARAIFPGRQPMGWIATALLGMAGSLIGGFLSSLVWSGNVRFLHPGGIISSVVGALILLWIVSRR
jgi:uncharacterized membrane protein YeaQ/YmgE (transglycosylase-associated protein family)